MIIKKKNIWLLILMITCGLCTHSYLYANNVSITDKNIRHHVIICFDQQVGSYNRYLNDDNGLKNLLKKIICEKDPLLRDGDYYSFLTYEEGNLDCTLKNYAQPAHRNSEELIWRTYKGFDEMFSGSWSNIANGHTPVSGQAYSLQTAAKSYCLARARKEEKFANRTYLVMITDDAYNGNDDFNKEFHKMIDVGEPRMSDLNRFNELEKAFLSNCRRIASFYRFDYMPQYETIINGSFMFNYKIMVFEVLPSSTFNLASVVDFPANLGLKRVRGGYLLDFEYQSTDSVYYINKFNVSIKNRKGNVVEQYSNKGDGKVYVKLKSRDLNSDSVEVIIDGWLRQMDGIYNGLEMSPKDPNYSRLTTTINLSLKNETKILGLIPLYDFMWWWFPNDLTAAVLIWDLLAIVIFGAIVCYFAYKLLVRFSAYNPTNNNIRITHL